ncbi:hypothetical protein F4809DRAFT_614831 [Biscogniauxia mediterranea]|nr:hypothetical protein F4809DRAFT_614831 [Biscogniauxia mediterranea]
MSRQISIQIPSRSGSPASATASSQKSNLQLQLADILVRVTTGSTTTTNSSEEEEEEDDEDDVCSSYDEDEHEDELPEAIAASSPDLYAEFAFLNPYASAAAAAASSQRNPSGPARVVCQTVEVPARAESHDEALTRLSSQLDLVHSVIRSEEAAALRFLRTLALSGAEAEAAAAI